jgi:predicted MFS family arabinose efflux permease
MGIGRFVLTPILPDMVEQIPLSASLAGFIASANFLGYLLGALAATALPRALVPQGFVVSLVISVLSSGGMALSDDIFWLAAVRALGGLASAGVLVFSSSLVLERLAARGRPDLADLHFAGVGLGIAGSALLVGILVAFGADWRLLWEGAGALSAVLCLAAWACLAPVARRGAPEEVTTSADQRDARGRVVSAALVRLALAYGLFGVGYVVTATFLTSILRASPTLAPFETPAWAAVGLSAALSVWIWRRVARRLGGGRAFALACLLEALGVAASVLVPGVAGLVLAAVLLGGTFMGITSLGLLEARRISTGDPRKVLGAMTACFSVGQMIGPSFAGVIADVTGSFFWPSIAAATVLLIAAVLVGPFAEPA